MKRHRIHILFITITLATLLSGCAEVDKSLYSLSNAVAPVDRVTGQRSLSFSSRQSQISGSNRQTQSMLQSEYINKKRPINAQVDRAAYQRLQRIFSRVHAVSHMSGEKWTAYLLPDTTWNAFTAGGTEIFVYKGLMDDIKNDDELAAIIGHEIAHVAANHIYEQQAHAIASSIKGSKSSGRKTFQAAFTSKAEEEADSIGILYAALAGYDPFAASRIWKRMYNGQGDFGAAITDHPMNSARYQSTLALANSYKKYYQPGTINTAHAKILAQYAGNSGQGPAAGEGGGMLAILETTMDALNKHQSAKTEEAARQSQRQFIENIKKSMTPLGRKIGPNNTLLAGFRYSGKYKVKNLNMQAHAGNERANDHSGNFIMKPNTTIVAEFKFTSVNLSKVDLNKIQIALLNAEIAN